MEKRHIVLIADDDTRIIDSLSEILLLQRYKVVSAGDGVETIEKVKTNPPDVILLDINMPGMSGIDVIQKLKADREYKRIPIVIVSGQDDLEMRVEALRLGADDFLMKPLHMEELTARVGALVKVKAYNDYMKRYQEILEEEVRKRTKELQTANEKLHAASLDTIYHLARAAEFKDKDTAFHLQRISNYASVLARAIDMEYNKIEALMYASPMHDIGKIGIPDRILLKKGRLNTEEQRIMQLHTQYGAQILDGSEGRFISLGKIIALTHHERWDGNGYPKGLSREDIPLEGRITAIADVFDALTSKRPYKEAFSNDESFSLILQEKGEHFDPLLVDAFLDIRGEILSIQRQYNSVTTRILPE